MHAAILILAALELIAPAQDSKVVLLPAEQLTVLKGETMEARDAALKHLQKKERKSPKDECWRKSLPVVFRWRATSGETGPWEVLVSKNADLRDARQFLFKSVPVDAATGREVGKAKAQAEHCQVLSCLNLEVGTRYYWRVASNITCGKFGHGRTCSCKGRHPSVSSPIGSFVTEDIAPRWIQIEGRTGNFRDLGGRIGLGGKRVRQGLVYRSQGLNDNSVDGVAKGPNRLTVTDVEYLTGTLGIRTDLDLRGPGEVAGLNGVSPLGKDVKYINRSSSSYVGIFGENGKKIMAANFREFIDRKNYPILFHCIGGADRTGALGYVLNGVLGVKRRELETDWESTFYPRIPDMVHADDPNYWCRESHFNAGFGKYGDANTSWNDRIVLYLKDCGITDDEIKTFREIMLD